MCVAINHLMPRANTPNKIRDAMGASNVPQAAALITESIPMNFLAEMLGQQQPQNALAQAAAPDPRLQRLLDQGMSPEEAQAAIAKMDAIQGAAQRPNPGSVYPLRKPMPTIGVRG